MKRVIVAALAGLFAMLPAVTDAHAGKAIFGTKDNLRKIQDVGVTGPSGERLYLGHKFSHHAFVLPYYFTDDGYILGVVGQDRYFKLDAPLITAMQDRGQLPNPLPPYEIGAIDYAMGYLLWIVLAAIPALIYAGTLKDRRKKAAIPFLESAIGHHGAGRVESALQDYAKALEIDAANPAILNNRGSLLAHIGQDDAAISDFSRAIRAEPKYAAALLNRGMVFRRKGLLDQAIADFARVIKISKGALVYQVRGEAYMEKGDFSSAIKDFSAAISIEPAVPMLYARRGDAHRQKGDSTRAAADFEIAQRLATDAAASG